MTTNADGNDELVGIDDVTIALQRGDVRPVADQPRRPEQHGRHADRTADLTAGGGTSPYTCGPPTCRRASALDTATGEITGTPTTAGPPRSTVTVTDNAGADRRRVVRLDRHAAPTLHPDRRDPGHRRDLAARWPDRHHRGRRHRRLPDRWLLRLLHPDPGRRHPERLGRASSSTAARAASRPTRRSATRSTSTGTARRVLRRDPDRGQRTPASSRSLARHRHAQDRHPRHRLRPPGTACLTAPRSTPPVRPSRASCSSPPPRGPRPTSTTVALLQQRHQLDQPSAARSAWRPTATSRCSPTEVIDAQATAAGRRAQDVQRRAPDHPRRRRRALTYSDDAANSDLPFPWFTADPQRPRRVLRITFPKPVDLHRSASTPGGSCPRPRSSATRPARSRLRADPGAGAAPRGRRRRRQARHVQRAELLPHHRVTEFVTSASAAPAPTSPTATGNQIANNSCNANGPRGAANDRQPRAPAGQDRRGHQHGRRRHRLPRGDRELGQASARPRDFAINAS